MDKKTKTAVMFHKNDLDGVWSGIIAKKYLIPRRDTVHLFGCDYGDIPKDFNPDLYDEIYMIDFSDDNLLNDVLNQHKYFLIDHHKSAIDKNYNVKKFCIDGVAACRLAFQFFTNIDYSFLSLSSFKNRQVVEPYCITLAGEYDIWDSDSIFAKQFNFGVYLYLSDMERMEKIYEKTSRFIPQPGTIPKSSRPISEELLDYIDGGQFILDYIKSTEHRFSTKFRITIDGIRFVVYNTHIKSSLIHQINSDTEDAIMVWNNNNPHGVSVSLYNESNIDLTTIAKRYGGGGHRQACGFRMDLQQFINIFINQGSEYPKERIDI